MWETLIPIAGNLLSGLFGKGPSVEKQYRQQRENQHLYEQERYKHTVQGALKAGLNPLTVIRGGGVSGSPQFNVNSPLGLRDYASEAFSGLGEALQKDDPIEKESRMLDLELKRRQLATDIGEARRFGQPVREGAPQPLSPKLGAPSYNTGQPTPEGQYPAGSTVSGLPVVDAASIHPEDARVMSGPNAGRYLIRTMHGWFYTPKNFQPNEYREAVRGNMPLDFLQGLGNINRAFSDNDWKPASVNDYGQTVIKPNMMSQSMERRRQEEIERPERQYGPFLPRFYMPRGKLQTSGF